METHRLFYPRPESVPPPPTPVRPEGVSRVIAAERPPLTVKLLQRLRKESGTSATFFLDGALHVALFAPEQVAQVLTQNPKMFLPGVQESAFSAAIGWGLISQEGADHLSTRRQIHSGMHGDILEAFSPDIVDLARTVIADWREKGDIALVTEVRRLAHQSLLRTLFRGNTADVDVNYESYALRLNDALMRSARDDQTPESRKQIWSGYTSDRSAISDYVSDLIRAHDDAEVQEGKSLISLLIAGGAPACPIQPGSGLHGQVALFLQAGIETTSSVLAWATMLLGRRPELWTALKKEADVALGATPPLSVPELLVLPTVSGVLNEAMRLFPPLWLFPRIALEDIEISGITIAKGTRVILSPFITQRDPGVFSRPRQFLPERWLNQKPASLAPGSFFPFGAGSRVCVGERLARLNATIMLLTLAQGPPPLSKFSDFTLDNAMMLISPRSSVRLRLPPA